MDERELGAGDVLAAVGKMIARLVRSSALERGDVDSALGQLTETAAVALGVGRVGVWLFSEDRSALTCIDMFERANDRHSSGQVIPAELAPRYFRALDSERTITANDAHADPRTNEFSQAYLIPHGIGAMLDAPIWLSGHLVGVVCHEHIGADRTWAAWEELVAGTFADVASMILGTAERVRQARALSVYGLKLEQLVDERTQRLRDEQQFLQTVFATAPFGMAFFDREGRCIRINDWLADLYHISIADTLGKRPTEVIPDRDTALAYERLTQQVITSGEATTPLEVTCHTSSPPPTFLISAYPIRTDAGIAHVGCFVVEVTALRAARQEAEAASRAKDDFLAILGHEMRNPLAPIQTALQLMEQRHDGETDLRGVVLRQVSHLSRLVDDLLDVSRITRGKVELRQRSIELATVIAKGIEMASPLLERRRQFLDVEVAETGLQINGDLDRLAQVVSNLLNNAAKFTPHGGRVTVSGLCDGDDVLLRVSDTGVGIATPLLPHLFDAFVQGERQLDRSQGGLGLGLAIAKGIVDAHGGAITATSGGPSRGSEFIVRLPKFEELVLRGENARIPDPPIAARMRILIVDDNEDAAEMLGHALEHFGHTVALAFNGPSAVAVAAEFRPHAALLDLGLPVMDGFELAGRLRALPGMASIKLVAVTGYGRPGDFERTKQAGFADHIVKPIELRQLRLLVSELLGYDDAAAPRPVMGASLVSAASLTRP